MLELRTLKNPRIKCELQLELLIDIEVLSWRDHLRLICLRCMKKHAKEKLRG